LVKLYDELVESVAGYSVGARELSCKSEIVREMDSFHKAYAAATLFEIVREGAVPRKR
jgi:hypothetical protein